MAACSNSVKSRLQFEISKCTNAMNSLVSLKASVVAAVDELVEKTSDVVDQARNLPSKDTQKYIFKQRLQKAYKLLKDYEAQLDSGPWKFGEDLEMCFTNEIEDATSISIHESLNCSFATSAPVNAGAVLSDSNDRLEANMEAPCAALSVNAEEQPTNAKHVAIAVVQDDQLDLINFDSELNVSTQTDAGVNGVISQQRLAFATARSSPLESGASGDSKMVPKFLDQPTVKTKPASSAVSKIVHGNSDAYAVTACASSLAVYAKSRFDSDEDSLPDIVVRRDVADKLRNEIFSEQTADVGEPQVAFDDDIVSSDSEMKYTKIDRWNLSVAGPFSEAECEVSYVESPSTFWCRNRPCIVNDIEEELRYLLHNMEDKKRVLTKPVLGEYCVVPSSKGYRRGRILEFKSNKKQIPFAKVLYIDYGDKAWVSTERLYVLPTKLFHYQWQASLCVLFGLEPANHDKWTFDVVQKFSEICEFQDLSLMLMNLEKPPDNVYTVKLLRQWTKFGESDTQAVENKNYVNVSILNYFPTSVIKSDKVPARRFLCAFRQIFICSTDPPENPEKWQIEFIPFVSDSNDSANST